MNVPLTFLDATAAAAAAEQYRTRIGSTVSQSDDRPLSDVLLDANIVTLVIGSSPDRFNGGHWEPLQIKALFTPDEWSLAKTIASDTFEALTLTFHPIESATVLAHLRGLIGPVLTPERFTEITGRAT